MVQRTRSSLLAVADIHIVAPQIRSRRRDHTGRSGFVDHRVRAMPAAQHVIARAAVEYVAPGATRASNRGRDRRTGGLCPLPAEQSVVAGTADQRVVSAHASQGRCSRGRRPFRSWSRPEPMRRSETQATLARSRPGLVFGGTCAHLRVLSAGDGACLVGKNTGRPPGPRCQQTSVGFHVVLPSVRVKSPVSLR